MTEPVLFRWPTSARFGRTVPKTKFYEHGNVRTSLRERFVQDIHRVTWSYKLADETMRLRASAGVLEIQVFTVEAKGADVPDDVLAAIDKTVHFPVIFEVTDGIRARTVAAQKVLGGRVPRVGPYHSSGWQVADAQRRPLPAALDLGGLHEALLGALLPLAPRAGELVSEATARLERARKLEREIAALQKRLRIEPQLNRKLELRRQLKERVATLGELTDPMPSTKD